MSLKHAILGFLSQQPLTGYELKKEFDSSVRFFWPADQSQIYRTLSKLVEEGMAVYETESSQRVLDLKRYYITPSGQQELKIWLEGPLVDTPVRDAELIQIFFYGNLDKEKQIEHLAGIIQRMQAYEITYVNLLNSLLPLQAHGQLPQDTFFKLSTVEYGLSNVRATLNWAKTLLERVQSNHLVLLDPNPEEG